MATISVIINGKESKLNVKNSWTPFSKAVTITDYNFDITFKSDTDNSCLISDLILISGAKKQYWSQNANETNTDTVKIGEGIQVESTAKNNYTRIDADGNRTFNKTTGVRTAELTDWGIYANELEVNGQAKLNILLIQEIDNQACLTGIGG